MSELVKDLQKRLNEGGFTCVISVNGREYTSFERGVKPLLAFLSSGDSFGGGCAADKTVGAGAAYLYVLLGVQALWANVISEAAVAVLAKHGINVFYGERVPYIINRQGNGICPIEKAVAPAENATHAHTLILEALQNLRK